MDEDHWQLGVWRRVPVSMHWTFLLSCAWLYLFFWSFVATAIGSIALLALFFAHEFGHVAVLRRKGISVEGIQITGIHGKTSHEWASGNDRMLVAWGGVAAQVAMLVVAVVLGYILQNIDAGSIAWTVAGPVLFVWTKLNVFLMVIALLPIGPFDGRDAWTVVATVRNSYRRRRRAAQKVNTVPGRKLSPEEQQALQESSTKATTELLARLGKGAEDRKSEDA